MIETEQHRLLVEKIRQDLNGWRKYTVVIDGVDGSGKSTLARYLAWQLGMPAIETDLFLIQKQGRAIYRYNELRNAVQTRHLLNWPVIIEGIFVLETLTHIQVSPDFLVYIENPPNEGGYNLRERLETYMAQYKPRENSQFCFNRSLPTNLA